MFNSRWRWNYTCCNRKDCTNDDVISACQEITTTEDTASSSSSKNSDIWETHKFNTDFEDVNGFPNNCPLCHSATKTTLDKPPSNYTNIPKGHRLRYSTDTIILLMVWLCTLLFKNIPHSEPMQQRLHKGTTIDVVTLVFRLSDNFAKVCATRSAQSSTATKLIEGFFLPWLTIQSPEPKPSSTLSLKSCWQPKAKPKWNE